MRKRKRTKKTKMDTHALLVAGLEAKEKPQTLWQERVQLLRTTNQMACTCIRQGIIKEPLNRHRQRSGRYAQATMPSYTLDHIPGWRWTAACCACCQAARRPQSPRAAQDSSLGKIKRRRPKVLVLRPRAVVPPRGRERSMG